MIADVLPLLILLFVMFRHFRIFSFLLTFILYFVILILCIVGVLKRFIYSCTFKWRETLRLEAIHFHVLTFLLLSVWY